MSEIYRVRVATYYPSFEVEADSPEHARQLVADVDWPYWVVRDGNTFIDVEALSDDE